MKKAISGVFLVMVFIMLGTLAYAEEHSEHQMTQMSMGEQKQADTATSEKATNVGNTVCPVSGEKVGQGGMEPVTYEYKGKIYNFCCLECIEEFKKDPEKYIKKVDEELQGKAEEPAN